MFRTVPGVEREPSDIAEAEYALERLFRLSMSRRMHMRQTEAVGVAVTRAGYAVLRTLDELGPLQMGEIARQCSMDPAVAARQVSALVDDALVTRTAGHRDARVSVVQLTRAGRTVYRRIVAVRTAYMHEVLAGWPAADRAELVRLVDRLVGDLKDARFEPRSRKGKAA
jgi:DNA-binding MarR family transcriptional regulator